MERSRRLAVALLACAAPASALAVVPAQGAYGTTHVVRIKDVAFHPVRLVVGRGDTVRWRFLDTSTVHSVTSTGAMRFRSSPTKGTGSYSVRFTRTGTYRYHCTIHPNMVARVVVR